MNAISIIMMSNSTIQITATAITTANIGKSSEPEQNTYTVFLVAHTHTSFCDVCACTRTCMRTCVYE